MGATRRSVLGVEISDGEIRAVRLKADGDSVRVAYMGVAGIPDGCIEAGQIVRPDVVGSTLSNMLATAGERAKEAIYSVTSSSTVARVLDVPPVDQAELRGVVEGEIHHFNILRPGSGSFGFVPIRQNALDTELSRVLVMAVDQPVLHSIQETAKSARVAIAGLEPMPSALLRAAMHSAGAGVSACYVLITKYNTTIAITDRGVLSLFRIIDHGAKTLCQSDPENPLVDVVATAIGTEVSRSIDYFRREVPAADNIQRVFYATNCMEAHKFAGWMRENLGLDTVEVTPNVVSDDPEAGKLALPGGHRYLGAFGIALRELGVVAEAPDFGLRDSDPEPLDLKAARSGLQVGLAVAIFLLAIGLGAAYMIGSKANTVSHALAHAKEELAQLQQSDRPMAESRLYVMEQLRMFASEGAPFPQIMDVVASSLDPGVGLSKVELDPSGRVRISGEAVDESAMIATLDTLRQYPSFAGTVVDSFQTLAANTDSKSITFEMSAQYLGRFSNAPGSGQQGGRP